MILQRKDLIVLHGYLSESPKFCLRTMIQNCGGRGPRSWWIVRWRGLIRRNDRELRASVVMIQFAGAIDNVLQTQKQETEALMKLEMQPR